MGFPICFPCISTTPDVPAVHSLWETAASVHGHPEMKTGSYPLGARA